MSDGDGETTPPHTFWMLLIICLALLLLPISLIHSSTLGFVLTWGNEGRPRFLQELRRASLLHQRTYWWYQVHNRKLQELLYLFNLSYNTSEVFFSFLGQLYWMVARGLDLSSDFFTIFVIPSHRINFSLIVKEDPAASLQMDWNELHRLRCHPRSGLHSRLSKHQRWIQQKPA